MDIFPVLFVKFGSFIKKNKVKTANMGFAVIFTPCQLSKNNI